MSLGPVDPNERVEVSVLLKPRRPLDELEARLDRPMTPDEFEANYGADPDAIARVEAFARQHGLEVVESSQARRTVRLGGRAADVAAAFGVTLERHALEDGSQYHAPNAEPQLPPELQGIVQAVFGLDTRPVARRR
jgi:kumamolisin